MWKTYDEAPEEGGSIADSMCLSTTPDSIIDWVLSNTDTEEESLKNKDKN